MIVCVDNIYIYTYIHTYIHRERERHRSYNHFLRSSRSMKHLIMTPFTKFHSIWANPAGIFQPPHCTALPTTHAFGPASPCSCDKGPKPMVEWSCKVQLGSQSCMAWGSRLW